MTEMVKSDREVKINIGKATAAPLRVETMVIYRSQNLKMRTRMILLHSLLILIFLYIPTKRGLPIKNL